MSRHGSRDDALARFYADHRARVERLVARRVRANASTIEDACQIAWSRLVARTDIALDGRTVSWLVVVATHAAWKLCERAADVPVGAFLADDADEPGVSPEPAGPAIDPLEFAMARETHEERARAFACLKPLERRELYLRALGYRYKEISSITGSTYTAVNRRITEGRARLRREVGHS